MRVFLAPMEGVVDYHLRKIFALIGGIDFCVTEFIRVNQHVLPTRVFHKYCPELLEHNRQFDSPSGTIKSIPIRVQLLGSDPKLLALNAQKAAHLGAIGIDLNFGCPAKSVNKNRGGACLLDETDLIYSIIKQVREYVPDHLPVTAKIRLGFNERDSFLTNARAIEDAGANELFVHARSKADGYKPPAYWSSIAEIKKSLAIPVIANGEIWTPDDFQQCKRESLCDDFMLGRGLLANPGLAKQIKMLARGQTPSTQPWEDTSALLYQLFLETSTHYPSKTLGNRVKQWLHYLRLHYSEAAVVFEKIKRLKSFDELQKALQN